MIEAAPEPRGESDNELRATIEALLDRSSPRAGGLFGLQAQWIETTIGPMLAVADHEGLHLLEFADRTALPRELERLQRACGSVRLGWNAMLDRTADALARYFERGDAAFTIPVVQRGSAFERSVWAALQRVPAGGMRTYGALAQAIGRPSAVRAVARANGANQVAILIPCHRIIGSDGALVGYGGKIWRKRWLLDHERRFTVEPRTES